MIWGWCNQHNMLDNEESWNWAIPLKIPTHTCERSNFKVLRAWIVIQQEGK
jgi:hypothetical protein